MTQIILQIFQQWDHVFTHQLLFTLQSSKTEKYLMRFKYEFSVHELAHPTLTENRYNKEAKYVVLNQGKKKNTWPTFPPLHDTNKLDPPNVLNSNPAPLLKKDWVLKSDWKENDFQIVLKNFASWALFSWRMSQPLVGTMNCLGKTRLL